MMGNRPLKHLMCIGKKPIFRRRTGMIDASVRTSRQFRTGTSLRPAFLGIVAAVFAGVFWAGTAAAGPKEQTPTADDHYQIYIGGYDATSAMLSREWGSIRLTGPTADAVLYPPALSGGPGLTFFTPSLSGVRIGVGFALSRTPDAGAGMQYTDLGPRSAQGREAAGRRQVGGVIGFSGLEIGATVGDHADPSCTAGSSCKTTDFWDIGVALRFGGGAVSAGYTASQPRNQRSDDIERIDVFSLNAGYKVTSRLDVYGGVDWIDTRSQSDAAESATDARFMLGTNLRF